MAPCGRGRALPLHRNGGQSVHSERAELRREAKHSTLENSQKDTVMPFSAKLAALFLTVAVGVVSAFAGVDTNASAGDLTLVWD
jgi:hypothetical protein